MLGLLSRGGSKRPMVGAAAAAAAYVDDDCHDSSSQSHVSLKLPLKSTLLPNLSELDFMGFQVQQGVADTVWKVGCYKIK